MGHGRTADRGEFRVAGAKGREPRAYIESGLGPQSALEWTRRNGRQATEERRINEGEEGGCRRGCDHASGASVREDGGAEQADALA